MAQIRLPDCLLKRGKGYAIRFAVRQEYHSIIGKKEIVRGLGTQDLGEAISKRDEGLAEITEAIRSGRMPLTEAELQVHRKPARGATIRDTAHRWLSESDGIKTSTRVRYRQHLEGFERFAGNIEVTKIDRELALQFIHHLRTTRSE